MPQISLKVNENGTLSIKDQNTGTPPLSNDGLLKSYAPLASPALTGNPTAPTPTDINDATTKIATTEFVGSKIAQVNNTINSVSGASVTLTGAQEITGSKTFTNNYTKIQDVSGNVKLEVKSTGVEIRGQIEMYGPIKPVNMSPGVVHKDVDGTLTTRSIMQGDIANDAVTTGTIDANAVSEAKIADGAVSTNKIAANAVTLAKINPSVYSVSNTPSTLVQRDSSGNMPANNNWTGNNAFSSNQFFIGGTVDAPMYKPFSVSVLNTGMGGSTTIQLAGTNLSRYYICAQIMGGPWDIYLPKMTSDMLGIVITFRNITSVIPTINAWSGDGPDQIIDNSGNVVTPTLDTLANPPITTVTIIAGIISGQIGTWYII